MDEVIEKTEAVIEQLQVVKKAMMQELLTRGLPGRHTRFKQTEIGEIPEEWEVVRPRRAAATACEPASRPSAQSPPADDGRIRIRESQRRRSDSHEDVRTSRRCSPSR